MKIEQFKPAHADRIDGYDWTTKKGFNALEDMLKNETVIVQKKHDGERIKMHIDGSETAMDSRRISKKTGLYAQCQQNFPEWQNLNVGLGYCVLDGELKAVRNGKDNWSDIVGVIHSLPERAQMIKDKHEFDIKYEVFDCCFYDGHDVRDLPYHERYALAQDVVSRIDRHDIELVPCTYVHSKEDVYNIRDTFIKLGYEGIVIKSFDRKYFDVGAYIKAKKLETKDIVVYDFEYGNGKYSGTVGALKCGYWDPDTQQVVHVCDLNCGTDQDRAEWLQGMLDGSRKYGVVEVKCQEVTKDSLRHPVYIRYRTDKSYDMCTKDTIFDNKES